MNQHGHRVDWLDHLRSFDFDFQKWRPFINPSMKHQADPAICWCKPSEDLAWRVRPSAWDMFVTWGIGLFYASVFLILIPLAIVRGIHLLQSPEQFHNFYPVLVLLLVIYIAINVTNRS